MKVTLSGAPAAGSHQKPTTQPPRVEWMRTWGGKDDERIWDVSGDSSGVYLAGSTNTFGVGQDDVLILKFSHAGDLLWARTWGGEERDAAFAVDVAPDGSVYVAGYTESFDVGERDGALLKFSPDGSLLWQRAWEGSGFDIFHGVTVARDGSVYVSGKTIDPLRGVKEDILLRFPVEGVLLKFSPDGSLIWQRALVPSLGKITVAEDGNLYAVGSSALLIKIAPNGDIIWQKKWGGYDGLHLLSDVVVSKEGSIYAVGCSWYPELKLYEALMLKFDINGRLIWQRRWRVETFGAGASAVDVTTDDGILVGGLLGPYVKPGPYVSPYVKPHGFFLLKLNADGSLSWQTSWRGKEVWGIKVLPDGSGAHIAGCHGPPPHEEEFVRGELYDPRLHVEEANILIVKRPHETITIPKGTLTMPEDEIDYAGGYDAFVMKLVIEVAFQIPFIFILAAIIGVIALTGGLSWLVMSRRKKL